MVSSVIARTLGLFDGVERPAAEALPSFLAARSLLLLLDNFEHLLDAAGEVATLVRVSPGSRVVITSRAPLHIGGEQEYPVRPLATGHDGSAVGSDDLDAATRLFIDRARAVRPDWEPGADLPIVVEICALLDGLPLGIELAAARLSLLPPAAIRDRLAARLPLPGSGPRDAPARQRTLEGAIDWSHDLLSPDEQATLHALAVFEGGFDVAQAEPVIAGTDGDPADALDTLLTLGDRSLIARDQSPIDDAGRLAGSGIRFGMLRTVQAYAARRLEADGRDAEVRAVMRSRTSTWRRPQRRTCSPPASQPWIDRLDARPAQPAGRPALGDRRRRDGARASVGRGVLALLADHRTARRGQEWAETALAMPGADEPTQARLWALAAAGGIAYWRSERDRSNEHYVEQLALAERLATRRRPRTRRSTSRRRAGYRATPGVDAASRRGTTPVRRSSATKSGSTVSTCRTRCS